MPVTKELTVAEPIQSAVVVGGGLAGIAAAMALAKRGIHVTLLESRHRIGGRAGSFIVRDSHGAEQETIDYCQHVGMGCCENLLRLIDWLGQTDQWHVHRQLHFFGPTGKYQRLNAWPIVPPPLHLTGWLLTWPDLKLSDRLSIARGLMALNRLPLDSQTATQSALDWLNAHHQTPRALERFWSTIIVSALGEELSRVSLAAVAKVLQDGFLRQRTAYHLLVPQRPLSELFGTQASERLKQHGVEIHLAAPVVSLAQLSPPRMCVQTTDARFEVDAVVVAVPWHQVSKIQFVDNLHGLNSIARHVGGLPSSAITGVHTWWDRPWLNLPHAAIVGRLCQWVFPKPSALLPDVQNSVAEGAIYYQIVISASRTLRGINADTMASMVHDDLQEIFPAVRTARMLKCKVVTDPQAVFSITPQSHQYRVETGISPRLAIAGDWTQTGWPATMEGAILSGFKAAEHLLRRV